MKEAKRGSEVVMGTNDRRNIEASVQTRLFKRVILHHTADFALVKVDKPFELNARVKVACLPKKGDKPPVGSRDCYIAGNFSRDALLF